MCQRSVHYGMHHAPNTVLGGYQKTLTSDEQYIKYTQIHIYLYDIYAVFTANYNITPHWIAAPSMLWFNQRPYGERLHGKLNGDISLAKSSTVHSK